MNKSLTKFKEVFYSYIDEDTHYSHCDVYAVKKHKREKAFCTCGITEIIKALDLIEK